MLSRLRAEESFVAYERALAVEPAAPSATRRSIVRSWHQEIASTGSHRRAPAATPQTLRLMGIKYRTVPKKKTTQTEGAARG